MLTCRHCGWENPDEAAFCTNCGRGLARGRGGEISDRPSQRFRALVTPAVRVASEPPPAAAPTTPRLNPPPSTASAPTLLDFRMPEQMLAELARAREARARATSRPPDAQPEVQPEPQPEVELEAQPEPRPEVQPEAAPAAALPEPSAERLEPETIEPEAIESEPPDVAEVPVIRTQPTDALPATLQDMPTLRTSRPVELGAVARALRAEVGSPPPAAGPPEEREAVVIATPGELLGGALEADLPPLPILDDDDEPFDEGAFGDPPFESGEDSTEASRAAAAEVDERPTIRLGGPADVAALLSPTPVQVEPSQPETRITQEDLPFDLPVDESADLMPDHLVEAADDSQGGLGDVDDFAGLLDASEPGSRSAGEGDDPLDDVEDDFIEEVEEGADLLASDEFKALKIDALARVAPPPLPPKSVRFLLRPLSENLDPGLLVPIAMEPVVVGRSEGDLRLAADEFASPRHARLALEGEELFVEDLGSLNGVWLRVRGDAPLKPGARFLAGQHVFHLEKAPINGMASRLDDGTRRLGADARHTPFQVVVQAGDGTVTHTHRLPPEGCRLGRHVADLVFTEDAFMSGTHALLRPRDEVVLLRDLASRNGTWVRLDGRARLEPGDAIMIGRSVLRVGKPAA